MKSNLSILFALCAGIAGEQLMPAGWFYFTGVTALLVIVSVIFERIRPLLLAMACGVIVHYSYNFEYRSNSTIFNELQNQIVTISGKISAVKKYPFAFTAILEADSLIYDKAVLPLAGRYQFALNYLPDLNNGDSLTLQGRFLLFPQAMNEGEFDRRRNAGYNLLNGTLSYPKIVRSKPESGWLDWLLFKKVQPYIQKTYNNLLDYRAANFQNALFLGVKTDMEKEELAAFANSGTLHLLAVSGMHIGFLLLFLLMIKKSLHLPHKIYIIFAIIILALYTILTGASPSVIRAFLMAAFFLLSYPLKRMINGRDLLAGAGIFSLLLNPNQLFTLSFQLSYLAVLSILLIYQRMETITQPITPKAGKTLQRYLFEPMNISLAVSLGTLPLLLLAGSGYNLLSVLANVPLIPLTALSYLGGILLLLTAQLPVVGEFNGWLLNLVDGFVFYLVKYTASWESCILHYQTDLLLTILLFAVLVYLFSVDYCYKISAQLVCCVCLLILIITPVVSPAFYLFSANKGEAVYMECGNQKVVCLNGFSGYEIKSKVLAYLKKRNLATIDYLIVSGVTGEDLAEITSQLKIRTIVTESTELQPELILPQTTNLTTKESAGRQIALDRGRIYFYDEGVMLQNGKQTLFCSYRDQLKEATYQLFSQKEGRKRKTYLSNQGKIQLLEEIGGVEILAEE